LSRKSQAIASETKKPENGQTGGSRKGLLGKEASRGTDTPSALLREEKKERRRSKSRLNELVKFAELRSQDINSWKRGGLTHT